MVDVEFGQYLAAHIPNKSSEDWKYTRLTPLDGREFKLAMPVSDSAQLASIQKKIQTWSPLDSYQVVLVNGYLAESISSAVGESGISISQKSFQAKNGAGDTFIKLSQKFAKGAIVIEISEGCELSKPLHIISYVDFQGVDNQAILPKARVIAKSGSRSTLVLSHLGEFSSGFVCGFTEVDLEKDSKVNLVSETFNAKATVILDQVHLTLHENAELITYSATKANQLCRKDLKIFLTQPGASAEIYGSYVARGQELVDNHTLIEHRVGRTRSRQLYKGVLDDRARAVFNGKINIFEGANGSDSAQLAKHLILNNEAEADVKPELMVVADDVKAAHGATVGQISEEELFYLTSRGISPENAQQMISHGFVSDPLMTLTHEGLRTWLISSLGAHS